MKSRVRIHRPVETRGGGAPGTRAATRTTYRALSLAWANLSPPKRRLQDSAAGEQVIGVQDLETHYLVDVQERDVLEVLAGPEAGRRFRVLSAGKMGTDRTVGTVDVFSGELEPAP